VAQPTATPLRSTLLPIVFKESINDGAGLTRKDFSDTSTGIHIVDSQQNHNNRAAPDRTGGQEEWYRPPAVLFTDVSSRPSGQQDLIVAPTGGEDDRPKRNPDPYTFLPEEKKTWTINVGFIEENSSPVKSSSGWKDAAINGPASQHFIEEKKSTSGWKDAVINGPASQLSFRLYGLDQGIKFLKHCRKNEIFYCFSRSISL